MIGRKKRPAPPVEPKVTTGDVEARVIAVACSQPPAGPKRWTLRLLESGVHAYGADAEHGDMGLRAVAHLVR